jgi:hypothetical protein
VLVTTFKRYAHLFGVLPYSCHPTIAYSPGPTAVCRPTLLSLRQHTHLSLHTSRIEALYIHLSLLVSYDLKKILFAEFLQNFLSHNPKDFSLRYSRKLRNPYWSFLASLQLLSIAVVSCCPWLWRHASIRLLHFLTLIFNALLLLCSLAKIVGSS